jgi:predicted MPP superfamily phosphohydrolase
MKNNYISISAFALSLVLAERTVKLNSDGKLKVIQITDIHYGEDGGKDANTTKLMKDLIGWETPDMAILTGDMVSGYAWDGKTQGWYES